MRITFYGVAVSAFVAKVRIALDLKGLAYEEVVPPDGYGSPAYRAIVPAGSVPGIVIDGQPLSDSNAILEWLEDIAPDPPLYPCDPYRRAQARALLGYHDTRLEAAVRQLFPVVKTDWRANRDLATPGLTAIDAALERLDAMITPDPYLAGTEPSIADLAYPVTVQMARMLADELEHPLDVPPRITGWTDAAATHPACARSFGIAGVAMETWLAGFRD